MSDAATGEKTEKPSAKKLKDARKKGQVPRSRDLVAAVSMLALTVVIGRFGPGMIVRLAARVGGGLTRIGERPLATISGQEVMSTVVADLGLTATVVGPLLAAAAFIAVFGNIAQSGWVFAPERLHVDFTRLSPANGLARLKPSQSGVDLLKMAIAVTVVSLLAYRIVREVFDSSPQFVWMTAAAVGTAGGQQVLRMLWTVGLALAALAGADYGLQYWRHYSSLKMTKKEQRDEAKSSEGSPEMKARVRKIQREMTRRRMLSAVKTATVVITNPTHYAVALAYRRSTMSAPVVVAKGKDLLAARIRGIARDRGIPIVENVSLAQALYKGAEVGESIPAALFGAVAEVLAYLVRIKQLML